MKTFEIHPCGHRHFHVIHTQVVVDNTGEICHIQSGFLGHHNDAQHFRLMPQIGHNQELDFPQNVVSEFVAEEQMHKTIQQFSLTFALDVSIGYQLFYSLLNHI
jgi:hypothetical protein